MGCFSFLCKECNNPINSSSFEGERVRLFLLKDGQVVQEMEGDYDSYGRVFINGTQDPTNPNTIRLSQQWRDPTPEIPPTEHDKYFISRDDDTWIWHRVCDLMSKGEGTLVLKYFDWEAHEHLPFDECIKLEREFEKTNREWVYLKGHEPKPENGIAAIHSKCFKAIPTTKSDRDPDQGWGELDPDHMVD